MPIDTKYKYMNINKMYRILPAALLKISCLLPAALLLVSVASCDKVDKPGTGPVKPDTPTVKPGAGTITVQWDGDAEKVCPGMYARVHSLNDGRYVMVYSVGYDGYLRYSSDGCKTWSDPQKRFVSSSYTSAAGVMVANAEFLQLSATNPHKPGRMIYAANLRPRSKMSSKTPYSIAIITSDDNGAKWSSIRTLYESKTWSEDVERGCYEPFLLELPDGTVQIYFADETPYYSSGKATYQNISMIESKDGGENWTSQRIVSYNAGYRDGMPVATLLNGMIYLAIEENGPGSKSFRPKIVCSSVADNWKTVVTGGSDYRFNPMKTAFNSDKVYAGAPYIIHTDNYIVLSYQSSEGSASMGTQYATMELAFCAVNEMRSGKFSGLMRDTVRPFDVDQTKSHALWGSLCCIGGDSIIAVTEWDSAVWIRRGKITTVASK